MTSSTPEETFRTTQHLLASLDLATFALSCLPESSCLDETGALEELIDHNGTAEEILQQRAKDLEKTYWQLRRRVPKDIDWLQGHRQAVALHRFQDILQMVKQTPLHRVRAINLEAVFESYSEAKSLLESHPGDLSLCEDTLATGYTLQKLLKKFRDAVSREPHQESAIGACDNASAVLYKQCRAIRQALTEAKSQDQNLMQIQRVFYQALAQMGRHTD